MAQLKLTDFYDYTFLSGLTFSPDKTKAFLITKNCDKAGNSYKTNLWLFTPQTKEIKPLTTMGDVGIALWLNDEEILFTAGRDRTVKEKTAKGETWTVCYKLSLAGGEAAEYMRWPHAVSGIRVLGDDKFVLTVGKAEGRPDVENMTGDAKAQALAAMKAEKDYQVIDELPFWGNGVGYTNGVRHRLCVYDRATGEKEYFCQYPYQANLLDVKGGKVLYTVQKFHRGLASLKNSLWLYDTQAKENKELIAEGDWRFNGGGFTGADDRIYVLATNNDRFGLNQNALIYFVKEGEMVPWCTDDISFGSSVGSDCRLGSGKSRYSCEYGIAFTSTERYSSVINTLTLDGKRVTLPMKTGSVDCFDKCADGTLYFIGMRDNRLQELYSYKGGVEEKISSFNDKVFEDKTIVTPEHFLFENDGVELDGFVLKPVDYDENKKYPAILDIHGGPKTVFGDVIYHEMQVWANMGYFVFFTNPRGGDGRGNEFADIRGRYGKEDYSDLMKFTDVVLEKYPQIDREKVGVTGGSYGGFMTNWIIGHTDRFAAAASQRSISNWISMAYISDIGYYFAEDQVASTPWTDMDLMWEQSPLKYADRVKTPTLFIHSDEDYRCPIAECWQMFSALKYHGVESRLCMFKGENHELSRGGKPLHRQRRLDEITDWFEKFLK